MKSVRGRWENSEQLDKNEKRRDNLHDLPKRHDVIQKRQNDAGIQGILEALGSGVIGR